MYGLPCNAPAFSPYRAVTITKKDTEDDREILFVVNANITTELMNNDLT